MMPGSSPPRIRSHLSQGCNLLLLSGGMSVDPDDVTRHAIRQAGATEMHYGSAVLPGAMFLVAYLGESASSGGARLRPAPPGYGPGPGAAENPGGGTHRQAGTGPVGPRRPLPGLSGMQLSTLPFRERHLSHARIVAPENQLSADVHHGPLQSPLQLLHLLAGMGEAAARGDP